jgi:catechol 2,3-dioxygenase-like lactoylglutathione lyase family enzyme
MAATVPTPSARRRTTSRTGFDTAPSADHHAAVPFSADLDHVALAVERWRDGWPRFREVLGGEWDGGGQTIGFAPHQLTYASGMRVEILRPHAVEHNDFLRRFIDQNGTGPHHLTYKVTDIRAAIDAATAAGYPPINVNFDDPSWMEAFLHPKAAHGIVVQLAQADPSEWDDPDPPRSLPPGGPRADLLRVVHLVADLDAATGLFAGLLGGTEQESRASPAGPAVELAWPGGGVVTLVHPDPGTAEADWLGDRVGRLHHVAFAVDDPATVPGAVPHEDGRWELPPDDLTGTRLVLHPRT